MILTPSYLLISILMMACVTYGLRLAPFLLFRSGNKTPDLVNYLGKAMPSAIIMMLILYSIRHVNVMHFPSGIAEISGILIVVALHLWKRQYLLSIIGGTVCYMSLLTLL